MGEHRLKPQAPPKPNPHLQPKFEWGIQPSLAARVVPKPGVAIIPSDAEIVELPPAVEGGKPRQFVKVGEKLAEESLGEEITHILHAGDPLPPDLMDLVVLVHVAMIKGDGIVTAGGGYPTANVDVLEIFRTSWGPFQKRCADLLAAHPPTGPRMLG